MDKKLAFDLATQAASRSIAVRRKVGAVIISDITNQPLSTGYNHNAGKPCEDEQGNTLDTVIHAERVALIGMPLDADLSQCTMYVTHQPCVDCEAMLKAEGLKYEVVAEFLKFDGNKLRYDLVPTRITKLIAFNCYEPDIFEVFVNFEQYRELCETNKTESINSLETAFLTLVSVVEGPTSTILPTKALAGIATVITFGARKYKPNNWRNCTELERYDAAFMRHYFAFIAGEELDSDSGYPHLWHALTNLAFLLELR